MFPTVDATSSALRRLQIPSLQSSSAAKPLLVLSQSTDGFHQGSFFYIESNPDLRSPSSKTSEPSRNSKK
ncbi:hypothetical protein COLO4_28828 [Corchorus olitorius]|uniref:Uncharacterized protein n=1 Tax=Corchorus olitorius TaxID=93759 RepID=A0A1R3HI43_9ROSI|nr:hypothetical protein COLO4_28828 [Corchorus olitorius]